MKFEENKSSAFVGEQFGFVLAYFLFTTLLFFLLRLIHKIDVTTSYFSIATVTLIITAVGIFLRWFL